MAPPRDPESTTTTTTTTTNSTTSSTQPTLRSKALTKILNETTAKKLPTTTNNNNNNNNNNMIVERYPTQPPPFTVGYLRKAIPKHCFERSLLVSSAYLLVDVMIVLALATMVLRADAFVTEYTASWPAVARVLLVSVLWLVYWVCQGCVGTGLWVIGHECGHGGFSSIPLVNDAVGLVVHTALLVPYFSWQISHRRHHSNTGNLDKDEVFVPGRLEETSDNPILYTAPVRFVRLAATVTAGWFLYLFTNATGRPYPKGAWKNHFHPQSAIFQPKERALVVISDLALLMMAYVLYTAMQAYGAGLVVKVFFVPYFIVNFWLVTITLLQHTDTTLAHYADAEWDWLRGALATMDRDFGFLNIVFHHIQDTHVAHHLFSAMPHYHAQEATEALKPLLGKYYAFSDESVWRALWNVGRDCHYVEQTPNDDATQAYWYRSFINSWTYTQKK